MADLVQGFITADWVQTVDLSTLELVSSSHVSDDLRAREDDIIWRVRRADGWLYIYLLLEFPFRLAPKMTNALGIALRIAFGALISGFILIAIFPAY